MGARMKVVVDPSRCIGHQICQEIVPDVFGPDAQGHSRVLVAELTPAQAAEVQSAVLRCPRSAIRLIPVEPTT